LSLNSFQFPVPGLGAGPATGNWRPATSSANLPLFRTV
jgi:hypothetical protein